MGFSSQEYSAGNSLPKQPPQHALRLSSKDLTGPDKTSALREFYGRELMRVDMTPRRQDRPAFFEATVARQAWITWAACKGSALELARTKQLLDDGCDDLLLATTSTGLTAEAGREILDVRPGGAALISKARQYRTVNHGDDTTAGILIPRARLAMLLPRLEEAPFVGFAPGTPGLHILFAYATAAASADTTPALQEKVAAHLLELMASIIEPQREIGGSADPSGLAEARYDAIKRSIRANLTHPGLTLERIARLHGLTPRYVQRLFQREDDSFSDFVRRERLEGALRALTDPRQRQKRILSVALDNGFADITTFNRAFRRAYGLTPSEARERGVG